MNNNNNKLKKTHKLNENIKNIYIKREIGIQKIGL